MPDPLPPLTPTTPRLVVACAALEPELGAHCPPGVTLRFLEQGLHRTPHRLTAALQQAVDEADGEFSQIVLGYGLCCTGVVGVRSASAWLVVPRVHDCISLYLGSREAYQRAFDAHPGTYYLTPGWLAERKDPLGTFEDDYVPRLGRAEAEWGIRQEYAHYTHLALVETVAVDMAPLRARALENARFLGLELVEIRGSTSYFEHLLSGPWPSEAFVLVRPGEGVPWQPFLDDR